MGWAWPLIFDPQGAFPHVCSVSFVPKGEGNGDPLILYLIRQRFAPLCLCHVSYLEVFARDKGWLFSLLLLLLPFPRGR